MQNSVDEKITGLSSEQVAERQAKGQVNTPAVSPTKTIAQIISNNIFTLFNAVNVVFFYWL